MTSKGKFHSLPLMNKPLLPPSGGGDNDRIIDEPLSEALSRRYLAYALSTITNRALPDVRDGLKPVHRRLLYSMSLMRLDPAGSAKKCARVVGDVIGRFHPHGDVAVYEAMVRLAQDFAQRYPLVDGQGNFGNIDGDNAAAMRYTECRLTAAAQLLLDGIDEDAVDFRATYDGEDHEPVVLPSGFPNLLANGSSGIAVGMATSIPPHNAGELIDGCLLLLAKPDVSADELMEKVPGPDFPTGGIIVEPRASLREIYETGRGGVRARARWSVEETGRGTYVIVITGIPYQVRKAELVEQLADLIESKKAALLGDVLDESAEDVRLVIEPKSRNVEPEVLMESLFKLSDLETRFPVNMNVLDARGTPGVMSLKQALEGVPRSPARGAGAACAPSPGQDRGPAAHPRRPADRLSQSGRGDPHRPLRGISEGQADRNLPADRDPGRGHPQHPPAPAGQAGGDGNPPRACRPGRGARRHPGGAGSENKQWSLVGVGLRDVQKVLGVHTELGKRRSTFADAPVVDAAAAAEAMIVREAITVILSERGWIRAQKGKVRTPRS